MEIGKLPNDVLERLVFKNIEHKRKEVMSRAAVGEDCSVIDFGDYGCVVSTDPITGATKDIGKLAINISCNDVASNGAEPIGILMTIMAPEDTTEKDIERVMKEAGKAAKLLNVEIIGGHTEITRAVNQMVISTTVIGKQLKSKIMNASEIELGDRVLITKTAGLEGTAIISTELMDKLKDSISEEDIQKAQSMMDNISVVKEGIICGEIGVDYMHDITEGGVLGAVWEASKAINKGIMVYQDSIPIDNISKKICGLLDINPLRLISSGSMLIICKGGIAEEIKRALNKENIMVSEIGEIVETGVNMKSISGEVITVDPPSSDELYKVI
ncbi:AIR synthase family protein [Clostridiisalibacter paucivorans]|uniref:AIR synthase family protein n=1 Tax=Clostridiisalibacter paucivorans TaxID=408753 RepID=UPI00047AAA40|nr:AIR synthase family protein [Clostridiisalibacter paucivorans]